MVCLKHNIPSRYVQVDGRSWDETSTAATTASCTALPSSTSQPHTPNTSARGNIQGEGSTIPGDPFLSLACNHPLGLRSGTPSDGDMITTSFMYCMRGRMLSASATTRPPPRAVQLRLCVILRPASAGKRNVPEPAPDLGLSPYTKARAKSAPRMPLLSEAT
ncbi:hypothetical protein K431DRAFT_61676 [Polychaeton citri CBS 116435]|uniref:Uncharacterized protein n=1 Tax=Polychaeton citri CBS 116435 TaxID=1314669 RepID=A0A9P4Q8U8_9PEZI|nr:hypothetical protein K431DRAFT_61676 [Polychaeton citri CBS 116435]